MTNNRLKIITIFASAVLPQLGLAQGDYYAALTLDPAAFTEVTVSVDGAPLALRRYEVVYAGAPVAMAAQQPARRMGPGGTANASETQVLADPLAYQKMAIYVPEGASDSTAIILNVNNSGWFASELRPSIEAGGTYLSTSNQDKVGAALAAGYVYVDMGSRGRGILAADGTAAGKAPAAIVDAKAAIRYLRLNDAALAGSAERIVITGTSGGGGMSAAVAASGNSADYLPYLLEIGAAGLAHDGTSTLNDDVFGVIAYCPITDLGHADMAYEWMFQGTRSAENTSENLWGDAAQAASTTLAAGYPAYLAGLNITLPSGDLLVADTMKDAIGTEVLREVDRQIAAGTVIPAMGEDFILTLHQGPKKTEVRVKNTWISVKEGRVEQFDFNAFLAFVAQTSSLKNVPAFDRTGNTGNQGVAGENSLFGTAAQAYANFTPYGWDNNDVAGDGSGIDDTGHDFAAHTAGAGADLATQIKLSNPMAYFGTDAKTAPNWYIRHGMIDRDTSFAVEVALYHAARSDKDVTNADFRLAWMTPHSGNYDVTEAYAWLATALAKTP